MKSYVRIVNTGASFALATVFLCSCGSGGSGDEAGRGSASIQSVATQNPESTSDTGGRLPASVPRSAPSGVIVLEPFESGDAEFKIGQIDMSTNQYSIIRSFSVPDDVFVQAPETPTGRGLSPSYDRLAANKMIGGQLHGGWIDEKGTFTDVNSARSGSDFDGGQTYGAIGFDDSGAFYYDINDDGRGDDGVTFKVAPGETDGVSAERLPDVGGGLDPVLVQNWHTGGWTYEDDPGCSVNAYSRASDSKFLAVDSNQLYLTPYMNGSSTVPCTVSKGTPLLPQTNRSKVYEPVASPDGKEVLFELANGNAATKLYTVATDGSANPTSIPLPAGFQPDQTVLFAWK